MPEEITKTPEAPRVSKITWGPLAAIIVTVAIYLLSQILGSTILSIYAGLHHWSTATANQWAQGVVPQFFYVAIVEGLTLYMLWRFLKRRRANFKTLGLTRPKWGDLGYTLVGFGIYFPILIAVMAGVRAWAPQINLDQSQQLGFSSAHGAQLALVFVSLVVLPPIVEETLVRGFLYLGLRRRFHVLVAALIASLLFATAHLEFGSGAPLLWSAAIDTFILSCVLIYLRQATGRLWASIGLHMLKNLVAFSALFIFVK